MSRICAVDILCACTHIFNVEIQVSSNIQLFFVIRWLAPLLLLLDLYEKVSVISKRKAEANKLLVSKL